MGDSSLESQVELTDEPLDTSKMPPKKKKSAGLSEKKKKALEKKALKQKVDLLEYQVAQKVRENNAYLENATQVQREWEDYGEQNLIHEIAAKSQFRDTTKDVISNNAEISSKSLAEELADIDHLRELIADRDTTIASLNSQINTFQSDRAYKDAEWSERVRLATKKSNDDFTQALAKIRRKVLSKNLEWKAREAKTRQKTISELEAIGVKPLEF